MFCIFIYQQTYKHGIASLPRITIQIYTWRLEIFEISIFMGLIPNIPVLEHSQADKPGVTKIIADSAIINF